MLSTLISFLIISYTVRYKDDTYGLPTNIEIFPLPATSFGGKIPEDYLGCKPLHSYKSFDCLSDKDFFMSMACLAARRSKDPTRQVYTTYYSYRLAMK